jgi:hypothetical protein
MAPRPGWQPAEPGVQRRGPMDQLAGTTSTGGIELVSDDLRIDGVRAASSVYERTVALCEARTDAAEKAWRDAEQEH